MAKPSAPSQMTLVDAPTRHAASPSPSSDVEALGLRFKDDAERRAHFLDVLAAKLREPGFRAQPGFPDATDEDILRLSDPPWYTACPNPFLGEFVRAFGKPYQTDDGYSREPLGVDTQVGKSDAMYKAHGYHTKVPHLAIVPSILHYTEPGDVVLDGFCGSGMTGVAAQWCGSAPASYQAEVAAQFAKQGLSKPRWGARRVVLNDLGPAATFIAQGFNLPFDAGRFEKAARKILVEVEKELGWMWETGDQDGKPRRIDYTVWSEVLTCPECSGEVVFLEEALNEEDGSVRKTFPCPHCGADVGKKALDRCYESYFDAATNSVVSKPKRKPVKIFYSVGKQRLVKTPGASDMETISRASAMAMPPEVPTEKLPYMHMTHERARMDRSGITHVHHFFSARSAHTMAALWRKASAEADPRTRAMLLWFVEQALWTASRLNRYRPTGYSQVNQYLTGVYYVPSQHSECSPWYMLDGKLRRLSSTFRGGSRRIGQASISTGTAASLPLPDRSIDYVFTDPPFGENIYYADLNYLVESWHRVRTAPATEAIVDQAKHKDVSDYGRLMRAVFGEYHRVLKPGRWMTMVFSNSHNAVWNAIQEALGEAGFVVADVRMLDKKQGSYRQVTSTAVKADLVVSCYKPSERLERRLAKGSGPDLAWAFVREHLGKTALVLETPDGLQVVAERTRDVLFDRLVAFCVQRHMAVPLSKPDFSKGLSDQFIERDGMWFLPDQVVKYDTKRMRHAGVGQLPFIVTDESTAIRWLQATIKTRPYKFEDLQPEFMKQTQLWSKAEEWLDLRVLLAQNFLQYTDSSEDVPEPILKHLTAEYPFLKGKSGRDPAIAGAALEYWYLPDADRAGDIEKRRRQKLLQEYDGYVTDRRGRIEVYRREAVLVGFQEAFNNAQWARILTVADKLPRKLLEEDFDLYMFVEMTRTQAGEA